MRLSVPRSAPSIAATLLGVMALLVIAVPLFSAQDPLAIGDVLRLRLLPPASRDVNGA